MNTELINTIQTLISNVGFPIVCVIFMWKKITDSDEKQTKLLTELTTAINQISTFISSYINK